MPSGKHPLHDSNDGDITALSGQVCLLGSLGSREPKADRTWFEKRWGYPAASMHEKAGRKRVNIVRGV